MGVKPTFDRRRLLRVALAGGIGVGAAVIAAACGEAKPAAPSAALTPSVAKAVSAAPQAAVHTDGHTVASLLLDGRYVANGPDIVTAANWDTMQTVRVEMKEFGFSPTDLSFELGRPYKLELVNLGDVKHESTAPDFFRSVAFRKGQDEFGEFKAPFLHEVEVFPGKQADLYFVPCHAGSFDLVCEIEGHLEAGMHGHISVVGDSLIAPAPVVTPVSSGDWLLNGSELVGAANWDTMQTVPIEMGEFWFRPNEIHLKVNQPYKLQLINTGAVKHEVTSEEFYKTVAFRKAENGASEFKAPRPSEVEVFAGKQTDLYLIPTKAGKYDLVCEIEGHLEAGMHGLIIVE